MSDESPPYLGPLTGPVTRSFWDFAQAGTSPLEIWYIAGLIDTAGQAATIFTGLVSTLFALPFMSPKRGGVIDRLGVNVTVGGAAGANAVMGIYEATSESNVYPGRLVGQTAELDVNATGVRAGTVSIPLRSSWLHYVVLNLEDTATEPTLRTGGVGNWGSLLGTGATLPTTPNIGWQVGSAYAATMPATFPGSATPLLAVPIPVLAYRFSA